MGLKILEICYFCLDQLQLLRAEFWQSLRLSLPLAVIQLSEASVSFVDTMMMGRLSSQTLAAGGLGAIIFLTVLSICMGMIEGVGAIAAEAYGRADGKGINQITAQGLWLCLPVSLVGMLLLWQIEAILPWLGQTELNAKLAAEYVRAVVWSFPAALGLAVFKEIATVLGKPLSVTAIALAMIPLNAIANYIFAFGKLGLPALGLAGLGIASTLIFWLSFLTTFALFVFSPSFKTKRLFIYLRQFNGAIFSQILKLGLPLMVQYGSELLLFSVAALLMGYWGTNYLVAHEIAVSILDITIMIPWGISYAAVIRVARALGQNQPGDASRAGIVNSLMAVIFTVIVALGFWFFPRQIVGLYLDVSKLENQEILSLSAQLFPIAAVFQIFYSIHFVSIGVLQGLLDTLWLMSINSGCYWLIGIGCGYIWGEIWQLRGVGLWWSLTFSLIISDILLILRFIWLIIKIHNKRSV